METVYQERKLLRKVIRKYHKKHELTIPLSDFGISSDNYYFKKLKSNDLLALSFVKENKAGFPIYDYLYLTDAGLHFFEIQHEKLKNFIFRSIATPVVVSIITTGLIWLIGWITGLVHIK